MGGGSVSGAGAGGGEASASKKPIKAAGDDERKWCGEEENGDEGRGGDGDIIGAAKRPPRDPDERLDDDHEDRGLDAEKGCLDERDLAIKRVSDAEPQDDEGARQHKEETRGKASDRAVKPPADIGGELHGLRTPGEACRNSTHAEKDPARSSGAHRRARDA